MPNRIVPLRITVRNPISIPPIAVTTLVLVLAAILMLAGVSSVRAQGEVDVDNPAIPDGGGTIRIFLPVVSVTNRPASPWPSNGMSSVSANTWLEWQFDPVDFPEAHFRVYMDDTTPEPKTLIAPNLTETHLALNTLYPDRRYYWQVVATSSNGRSVAGPVWTFRTEAPTSEPEVGVMITIPEGEFQMGCDPAHDGEYLCRPVEMPLHPVWLSTYEIDKYEVTNVQYRECVAAGQCDLPRFGESLTRPNYYNNPSYDLFPVLYVSWWNARDYCAFADKRLPSEAEWEKAARGPIDTRPWPWGDSMITCEQANFTNTRAKWEVCVGDTTQVGSYPLGASPYGVMDMPGNAFEWVRDRYDTTYYNHSPYVNPTGPDWSIEPDDDPIFIIRGGSYRPNWHYPRTFFRHWGHHGHEGAGRDYPYYRNNQVGFRCAR